MDNTDTKNESVENPQIVFAWKAPVRAYKSRSAGVMRFYIAVTLLLSAIVFLFGDKILVLPIATVMFLFYALTITPPPLVENKITKFGIENGGNSFRWETLSHFFYTKRFDYFVITLISFISPTYRQEIYLIAPDAKILTRIIHLLSEHLIFLENPPKSTIDHITDFIMRSLPNEETLTKKEIDHA